MAEAAEPRRSWWTKLRALVLLVGPGIFLVGYNIGTGSVTTMAATGADYGLILIWPLLLSCLFTYVLIVTFGRYTAVTGQTALYSFKTHFGRGAALFVIGALLFTQCASFIGVMAIVVETVREWSRPLTASGEGFNMIVLAVVFGAVLYGLFLNGRYAFFEKILIVFVTLMGLSFVLTMAMVIPAPGEVLRGLVPRIPQTANAALLIGGMVGTTMAGVLYVVRSILVKEKGWTAADLPLEKRDAGISSLLMFLISLAVMACAAWTLHPRGLRVENAIDMVQLLEPLAGRFAISLFVAGIVSAGLSSLFPIAVLPPWLLADYRNTPRDLRTTPARLMVLGMVLLGLVVPVFGGRPVLVMIASQALGTVVTPVIILLMILLQNKKGVMGAHRPSRMQNAVLLAILAFAVLMAGVGLVGIAGLL